MRLWRLLRERVRARLGLAHPATASIDQAMLLVSRAAALVRGGVPPGRILGELTADLDVREPVTRLVESLDASVAERDTVVSVAVDRGVPQEWRLIASAWRVAEASGAPLARALDEIGASLRSLAALRERRGTLLAGPRATVRLIAFLPVGAILLGTLLGFDPIGTLLTPAGSALLAVGVLLQVLGIVWARALTQRVQREDHIAGLEFMLLWIALSGGAPISDAMTRTIESVDRYRVDWIPFDAFRGTARLRQTLDLADERGMPVRALLLQESTALRAQSHAELEQVAERLGVRILLPLGLCALPAFVTLGVLPVVIAMLAPIGAA